MRSINSIGEMCGERLSFSFRTNTATSSPESLLSNGESENKTGAQSVNLHPARKVNDSKLSSSLRK